MGAGWGWIDDFVQGMDLMKNIQKSQAVQKKGDFIEKTCKASINLKGITRIFLTWMLFKKEFDNQIQLHVWVFWYKNIVDRISASWVHLTTCCLKMMLF